MINKWSLFYKIVFNRCTLGLSCLYSSSKLVPSLHIINTVATLCSWEYLYLVFSKTWLGLLNSAWAVISFHPDATYNHCTWPAINLCSLKFYSYMIPGTMEVLCPTFQRPCGKISLADDLHSWGLEFCSIVIPRLRTAINPFIITWIKEWLMQRFLQNKFLNIGYCHLIRNCWTNVNIIKTIVIVLHLLDSWIIWTWAKIQEWLLILMK